MTANEYYALLNIRHGASDEEIKNAYLRKSREASGDPKKLAELSVAYGVLSKKPQKIGVRSPFEEQRGAHSAAVQKELAAIRQKSEDELAKQPNNPDALKNLIVIGELNGDGDISAVYLEMLLRSKNAADRMWAIRRLAAREAENGNPKGEYEYLTDAYKGGDAEADDVIELARLHYIKNNNLNSAIIMLSEALSKTFDPLSKIKYTYEALRAVNITGSNKQIGLQNKLYGKLEGALKAKGNSTEEYAALLDCMEDALLRHDYAAFDKLSAMYVQLNIKDPALKAGYTYLKRLEALLKGGKIHAYAEALFNPNAKPLTRASGQKIIRQARQILASLKNLRSDAPELFDKYPALSEFEAALSTHMPLFTEFGKMEADPSINPQIMGITEKLITYAFFGPDEMSNAMIAAIADSFLNGAPPQKYAPSLRKMEKAYPLCYRLFSDAFLDGKSTEEIFGKDDPVAQSAAYSTQNSSDEEEKSAVIPPQSHMQTGAGTEGTAQAQSTNARSGSLGENLAQAYAQDGDIIAMDGEMLKPHEQEREDAQPSAKKAYGATNENAGAAYEERMKGTPKVSTPEEALKNGSAETTPEDTPGEAASGKNNKSKKNKNKKEKVPDEKPEKHKAPLFARRASKSTSAPAATPGQKTPFSKIVKGLLIGALAIGGAGFGLFACDAIKTKADHNMLLSESEIKEIDALTSQYAAEGGTVVNIKQYKDKAEEAAHAADPPPQGNYITLTLTPDTAAPSGVSASISSNCLTDEGFNRLYKQIEKVYAEKDPPDATKAKDFFRLAMYALENAYESIQAAGDAVRPVLTRQLSTDEEKKQTLVPSVIGLTADEARAKLSNFGFGISVKEEENGDYPQNQIFVQDPAFGTNADAGTTVTVTVAKAPETAVVPDLKGLTEKEAAAAAAGEFFELEVSGEAPVENAEGKVSVQEPAAGTNAKKGSKIVVTMTYEEEVNLAQQCFELLRAIKGGNYTPIRVLTYFGAPGATPIQSTEEKVGGDTMLKDTCTFGAKMFGQSGSLTFDLYTSTNTRKSEEIAFEWKPGAPTEAAALITAAEEGGFSYAGEKTDTANGTVTYTLTSAGGSVELLCAYDANADPEQRTAQVSFISFIV